MCVCVCSLLGYRLKVLLPQLPEIGCLIFLEIQNLWGKVEERSCLGFENFCLEVVLNRQTQKQKSFFGLIMPFKTWWKPRFSMDVEGCIAYFGICLDIFEVFAFWMIFSVFQKNLVFG